MITPTEKSLSDLTTLRIGGTSEVFELKNRSELAEWMNQAENLDDAIVLGRGSNMLFPDDGIDRPLVTLSGQFEEYTFHDGAVTTGAGVFLPEVALEAARRGYSGLEWAAGVPGSVGGAVAMNAGAFQSETQEALEAVGFLSFDGVYRHLHTHEINFSYRFCELRDHGLIVSAIFQLEPGRAPDIQQRTKDLLKDRRAEQPVGTKSAGCVFRNPNGHSAGELIDRAGLKGASEGPIEVSEQHANYFTNRGEGTYEQMRRLIDRVRDRVLNQFDVELPLELRVVQ
ncbi:MAG: UDP-N-acetylmuramate dehydrogenase [bacterium]